MTPYETENDDKVIEHNQATTSGMTDSSNASGSMSSSPISIGEQRLKKDKTNNEDPKSRITIKATYKEDTVRFKFEPSAGCHHLYEEVAKRFETQRGTFQLKYVDDEDEWVMLVSDLDLQECLEIMECLGKNSIKFLVRDLGFGMGSLVGSNRVLPGSCQVKSMVVALGYVNYSIGFEISTEKWFACIQKKDLGMTRISWL